MNNFASLARAALVAVAGLCAWAGPANAQTVIGGYRAVIGQADLMNSRGVILTHPWQVVRQDRANVHRFGISQPGDEGDPWFASGEMRTALESWVRYSAMSPATGAEIMAGGGTIYVEVLGQGSRASGVRVTLDGSERGGGDPGAPDFGGSDMGSDLGGDDLVINPE